MEEKKCKKCGTTENVNFEGMCKKCYEDTIVIKQKEDGNGKKKNTKKEENESLKALKTILKEKYAVIESVLGVFCFILIIISILVDNDKMDLENKYNEINSKYVNTDKELQETKTKLADANQKISQNQSEIEELKQIDKQEEISNNITTLESKVTELTNQKASLETQVSELNSEVIKLKGEPKTYPAGQLVAGTDVPTGKYKIYGGNSNFVVYSASGSLQVNIVLGTNAYSVSEYIYTFKTGDKIEARSSFKLVEVE